MLWIRGCCLERLDRLDEALSTLVKATEMLPTVRTKRRVATVEDMLGHESEAIQTLHDILDFCPQNVDILLALGTKLDKLGKSDESFTVLAEAAAVVQPSLQLQINQ